MSEEEQSAGETGQLILPILPLRNTVLFPEVVIPLQVWGLRYALDVVLETEHPDWIMHEYARIDIPDPSSGAATPIWIAKDASTDFVQTITAGVTDIRSWVPEIPVPRNAGAVTVTDHSEGAVADLRFQYTNPRGEAVDAHYRGAMPTEPAKPRNGNTMGHSRPSLAALLDGSDAATVTRSGARDRADVLRPRVPRHVPRRVGGHARKLHDAARAVPRLPGWRGDRHSGPRAHHGHIRAPLTQHI